MADNRGTLFDEDGDATDWIEIHNRGEATINLQNHHLTDDSNNLQKWSFPESTLQAGARLLIFASGKDRRVADENFHTNFSLDADGEYLALIAPDGSVLSEWDPYPALREDESFGLAGETRMDAVIDTRASCRWLVPFGVGEGGWEAPDFDDSLWSNGSIGLGYDFGTDYQEWIFTDTQFDMFGFATTLQARVPFEVSDLESVVGLELRIRFDDGFVAFLNGVRVASEAAPEPLLGNSAATSDRAPSDASQELVIDLSEHLDRLSVGSNILAVQGLDVAPNSGDFLLHPRLLIERNVAMPGTGLMDRPTPGEANTETFGGRVREVSFDRREQFAEEAFTLTMSTETPGADIFYALDGTPPTPEFGVLYEGPITIDETFSVRARAFKEGCLPSEVTTRTYIFAQELAAQSLLNQSVVEEDREAVEGAFRERSLPILSVAVDPVAMFGAGGISTVPEQDREIRASLEYLPAPGDGEGFQLEAGLGIHGGNAREHPKKPFRLFFRGKYGSPRLNYPLFEGSAVTSFDQLILRAGGHDSWSISEGFGSTEQDLPFHASYLRDQFLRKTETDMGRLAPRGRYVQVILNGFYWGVYDLHERPNANFFSDHLGGRRSDWDVLHHADSVGEDWATIDGEDTTWSGIHERLEEGVESPETLANLQTAIDLDELIDSLIVRMWSGDFDWAGPILSQEQEVTFFRNKNWYAAQRRGDPGGLFRFFTWDAEMSMGMHLLSNVFNTGIDQRVLDFDLTEVNDPGTPAGIHQALRALPAYRQRFGDRVQKHLFEDGVLTVEAAQNRLDGLVAALDPLMVAESARWGDLHSRISNFTKAANWDPEVAWLRDTFIPQRREILLDQLRASGLFPEVTGVKIEPFGGSLDDSSTVDLLTDSGTIHFTTDGSDPAAAVGFERTVVLDARSEGHFFVPTEANGGSELGERWKDVEAPLFFERWTAGRAGIGYEAGLSQDYQAFIETDVSVMNRANTSIYLRVLFDVPDPAVVDRLILRARFDDGFAAFLNGVQVASSIAPEDLAWNSQAIDVHLDDDAVFFRDFDLTAQKALLRDGSNLLAIQGLNRGLTSSDFLFAPELVMVTTDGPQQPSATAQVYDGDLTLDTTTVVKARTRTDDGQWSALSEALFFPGQAPSPVDLRISEIHYHPVATESRPGTAFEFVELVNLSDNPVQLLGIRFSEGIDFEFGEGLLQAGERLLLVNDEEAFRERYPEVEAARIVGAYGADSRLSNGGERLTLVDANNQVLDHVSYEDGGDWPAAADGGGVSLVRVDPSAGSGAENWRVSLEMGGTPGEEGEEFNYATWRASHFAQEADGEPLADPDEDLRVNLLEYLAGTNPQVADPGSALVIVPEGGGFVLEHPFQPSIADVAVAIESSDDLNGWNSGEEGAEIVIDNRRRVLRYPLPNVPARYYRLSLTLLE